jgi:glycosyltransferase involved in cell wall biosynthesis
LLVGQWAQPTGMARVLRALAGRLGRHRDVEVLAIDASPDRGDAGEPCSGGCAVHVNPCEHDPFAERRLEGLSAGGRFDSIVLYHDPWFIHRLAPPASRGGAALVAYCPIDGAILRPDVVEGLSALDALAVPTAFAASVVAGLVGRRALGGGAPFDRVAILPHGVDTDVFSPLGGVARPSAERRLAARRAAFPDRPELWSGFLVLNANRNHARKRLDITLRGFAAFARGKPPDVRLYVHWSAERTGVNVPRTARALGIEDRVITPDHRDGVATPGLNLLYNAADVGVNTSTGEGWGLPAFEHAATAAAQVVPAHSACGELWRDAALLLPVQHTMSLAGVVEGGEVSPLDLAAALERLHADPELRAAMALAAHRRACSDAYQWDGIAGAWHAWLSEVEARPAPRRPGLLPLEGP